MTERSQKEVWRLTPWLLLILLLGNFVLMAYDAKASNEERVLRVWVQAVAYFIQSPLTSINVTVTGAVKSFLRMRTAETENSRLKKEVQQLQVEAQKNKKLAAENKRLKELLELKGQSKHKILTARVIARDTSAWFDAAVVNRGSLDGIKLNMPVVINGGLIGRVTAVSPLTAQIHLITKDKFGIGGIVGELENSNALGVIRGIGNGPRLEMSYVPGYAPVNVGDIVYTTGQGGIYPPGLKIGEVDEVQTNSAIASHDIFIKPVAKLHSMQEVAILLYTPPPRPKYQDALLNAVKEEEKASDPEND